MSAYSLGDIILVPNIRYRNITTDIAFGAGPNPVEVAPQNFNGTRGRFTMSVVDQTTGFMFSFIVEGGRTAADPTARLAQFAALISSAINCTVTQTVPNLVTAVTGAADSGGRTYNFVFQPVLGFQPTIFKSLGAVLAGGLRVISSDAVPKE